MYIHIYQKNDKLVYDSCMYRVHYFIKKKYKIFNEVKVKLLNS